MVDYMIINKFKNGNVNLKLEKSDFFYYEGKIAGTLDIDALYHYVITMDDLVFNTIDGYMYLIDWNTQKLYDFSDCYINILSYLESELLEGYKTNKMYKLYPMSNKDFYSLMIDLKNGY
jgi:hypothetical protein